MIGGRLLRRLGRGLFPAAPGLPVDNVGDGVGQWPRRAIAALGLVRDLPLAEDAVVADVGCGRQTLRALMPTSWRYHPFDSLPRTPDTVVCDFDHGLPAGRHDVAFMLGVLEYLAQPLAAVAHLVGHSRWAVVSYCHFAGDEQRNRQGWKNNLSHEEITTAVSAAGGAVLRDVVFAGAERLYLIRGAGTPDDAVAARPDAVLLSAAYAGDNAGDAIIEDAVRRITGLHTSPRLPLTRRLDDAAITAINASGRAIVCGTNLYQRVFAGNLDVATIRKITVPITLLGIGSSDVMGAIPRMDAAGVKAVRLLHERAGRTSVRDEASWRFLKSIGITNAEVTGCPVLFHGLQCPDFTTATPAGPTTLTLRSRLLHVDASWEGKQTALLHALARHFHPQYVLQSPYDQDMAGILQRDHGGTIVQDPWWQAPLYVSLARSQARTMGFRLHFCMLSLAHGRPATLISHDSRASEFCQLVDLPVLRLDEVSAETVIRVVEDGQRDWSPFTARWKALSSRMRDFLAAEGLACRLRL
jgi:hypothetical protein